VKDHAKLLKRFWSSASGFWRAGSGGRSWFLTAVLLTIVVLQLMRAVPAEPVEPSVSSTRSGARMADALLEQILLFVPLAAWCRRARGHGGLGPDDLAARLAGLAQRPDPAAAGWPTVDGSDSNTPARNTTMPNIAFAEDVRIATDVPYRLGLRISDIVLTALTFIHVLWAVGGSMTFDLEDVELVVPGYLVVGALAYSIAVNSGIMLIGRDLTSAVESKNRTEAHLRAEAGRLGSPAKAPRRPSISAWSAAGSPARWGRSSPRGAGCALS
jgi:putative ATP-binding cassette transporter